MYVTEMRKKTAGGGNVYGIVDEGNSKEFVCANNMDTALGVMGLLLSGSEWSRFGHMSFDEWEPVGEPVGEPVAEPIVEMDRKPEVSVSEDAAAAIPFARKISAAWLKVDGWAVVLDARGKFIWCGRDEGLADTVLSHVLRINEVGNYKEFDVSELSGLSEREFLSNRKMALLAQLARIAEELSEIAGREANL